MSKKLQAQIDEIKKSILNKNVTNTSMVTYGKLNEIGQSLYRYDQLSKAGLKDDANAESTKVNNLISNFNEIGRASCRERVYHLACRSRWSPYHSSRRRHTR